MNRFWEETSCAYVNENEAQSKSFDGYKKWVGSDFLKTAFDAVDSVNFLVTINGFRRTRHSLETTQ